MWRRFKKRKYQFNIFDIEPPTEEQLAHNRQRLAECERLGLNTTVMDDEHNPCKQELIAELYILADKKVPRKIEEYLLKTKESRTAKYKNIETITFDMDKVEKEYQAYMKNRQKQRGGN